jgi:oxygen-dependent protoporphyrinogen oxidase
VGMLARKRQQLMQKPGPPEPGNNHQPFSLFMTLKNGLGEMVDAVIEKSPDVSFRARAKVKEVTKGTSLAWQVVLEGGEIIATDAVMFATPAKLSASFLKPIAPKVADLLNKIKYVSTATVTLAYKKEGFSHPLNGFGFVVPRTEGRKILACTWTSSKFPHRTPDGYVMLRCFVGGALNENLAEQDEEAIATMVKKELADLMGIHQEPEICKVFHNKKSNVQYLVGHANLIESVQKELQAFDGLFLTGSAYTGIGIPDCIQNGTRTAQAVVEFFSRESQTKD